MKLTGLQAAWFRVYRDARDAQEDALQRRGRNRFGILVHDDRWALEYQLAFGRAARAAWALSGPGTVAAYIFPVSGPVNVTQDKRRDEFLRKLEYRRRAKRILAGVRTP